MTPPTLSPTGCPRCGRVECPTLALGPEPEKWKWEYRAQSDGSELGRDWLTPEWLQWDEARRSADSDCRAHKADWPALFFSERTRADAEVKDADALAAALDVLFRALKHFCTVRLFADRAVVAKSAADLASAAEAADPLLTAHTARRAKEPT